MAQVRGDGFWAVANGRVPGIYTQWHWKGGAAQQVQGFSNSRHRKFKTRAEAEQYLHDCQTDQLEEHQATHTDSEGTPSTEKPLDALDAAVQSAKSAMVLVNETRAAVSAPGGPSSLEFAAIFALCEASLSLQSAIVNLDTSKSALERYSVESLKNQAKGLAAEAIDPPIEAAVAASDDAKPMKEETST